MNDTTMGSPPPSGRGERREGLSTGQPLRVLVLEDNAVDAEMVVHALRRAGFDPDWKRVETKVDFLAALDTSPELILSDYSLPHFDGVRALQLLRESGLDIPFILISGTLGEEAAVEAMKLGATDYLLKDRVTRLGPAVERALEEKRLRDERRLVDSQLRESEERFRELAETIEEVFWITDPNKQRMLYVSPAYEKIWGRSCQGLYDQPHAWLDTVHAEDRERVRHAVTTRQARSNYDEEYRIVRADGGVRWIHDRAFPVRNAAGEVERIVGVARDITDYRQVEAQFRQSQKMEAIGQLAGGVAHDFNNILAAMMIQAELAVTCEGVPADAAGFLLDIEACVERAASLTRQLLAFSRRQVIQPRRLNLNESVTCLGKMLRRILGEDVKLELELHPTPLLIQADAGMLDQVLMNLVVNARDAMPQGGRLSVETTECLLTAEEVRGNPDVSPGRHICLRVSDSGQGIAPEILPHIFEPFFTTKEVGKGTGLGLATVFGIVKQHRGLINVTSQVGQGTRFEILLPIDEAASGEAPAPRALPGSLKGTETILLVEDDGTLRKGTRLVLERRGYHVLEAAAGAEALAVWDAADGKIQVLLTDLVMPGLIKGWELPVRLQKQQPGLKVIFTSGYSADFAQQAGPLREGQNFLPKPWLPSMLYEILRRSLDS